MEAIRPSPQKRTRQETYTSIRLPAKGSCPARRPPWAVRRTRTGTRMARSSMFTDAVGVKTFYTYTRDGGPLTVTKDYQGSDAVRFDYAYDPNFPVKGDFDNAQGSHDQPGKSGLAGVAVRLLSDREPRRRARSSTFIASERRDYPRHIGNLCVQLARAGHSLTTAVRQRDRLRRTTRNSTSTPLLSLLITTRYAPRCRRIGYDSLGSGYVSAAMRCPTKPTYVRHRGPLSLR